MSEQVLAAFKQAYAKLSITELKRLQRAHERKLIISPSAHNQALMRLIETLLSNSNTY